MSSPRRTVQVQIDDDALVYEVEADSAWGAPADPLAADDDLIAAMPWSGQGYTVAPFVDPVRLGELVDGVRRIVVDLVGNAPAEDGLERYHHWVDEDQHLRVSSALGRGFTMDLLPIPLSVVEERISAICGVEVRSRHPVIEPPIWAIRLVRPHRRTDHNPPHRDQWIDHLRSAVNLYAPLAGSTSRSSLPLVPGSHHWPESRFRSTGIGPVVDGVQYVVPALVGADQPIRMTRPNPPPGSCLVFSPYLLHGGGINLADDVTRVSLEMRFWRAEAPPRR